MPYAAETFEKLPGSAQTPHAHLSHFIFLQDIPSLLDPENATGGNAFLQVWHDRTATATYSHLCDILAITCLSIMCFLNAVFAMTAASRMVSRGEVTCLAVEIVASTELDHA